MGTIGREFFGDQNQSKKETELPDGACVRDIFAYFHIPVNPEYAGLSDFCHHLLGEHP